MNLPAFDGLTREDILEYGSKNKTVAEYLPDERDIPRLPRQFLIDLMYALCKTLFKEWADEKMDERHAKLAAKNDLLIKLDPNIAKAFASSKNISSK